MSAGLEEMQIEELVNQGTQTNFLCYVAMTDVEAVPQRDPYSWGNIELLGLDDETLPKGQLNKRSALQRFKDRQRRVRSLNAQCGRNGAKSSKSRRRRGQRRCRLCRRCRRQGRIYKR